MTFRIKFYNSVMCEKMTSIRMYIQKGKTKEQNQKDIKIMSAELGQSLYNNNIKLVRMKNICKTTFF